MFRRFLQGLLGAVSLLCCTVYSARGQQSQSCSQPMYHRMDYTIGEWEAQEAGARTGFARFTSASMGCAIVEDWMPVGGRPAKGLLFYDPRIEAWRTIHISSTGVTETREEEPGLFVSKGIKRRFLKEADRFTVEETSGPSLRRLRYLKASSQVAAMTPENACNGPEYRQSDIWLGDWEAIDPRGERIALRSVQKALGGCLLVAKNTVIRDNSPRGTGTVSFSFWDARRSTWRDIGVTPAGVDEAEGTWADGVMRATSDTLTHGASKQMNRGVTTPLPDGTIDVNWQRSNDDGKTWRGSYVAKYRRIN